jgi:hypothetical protein
MDMADHHAQAIQAAMRLDTLAGQTAEACTALLTAFTQLATSPGAGATLWDLNDLAGITEIAEMLWPDGTKPLASALAQVSMWARRRETSGFPLELVTLARGGLWSRRQVQAWWLGYRTRPRAASRQIRERA